MSAPDATKPSPAKLPKPTFWTVTSMVLFLALVVIPLGAIYGLGLNYNNNPLYSIGFLSWAGAFIYIWAGVLGGGSITGSTTIWMLMGAVFGMHVIAMGLGFRRADRLAAVFSALAGVIYLPLGILGLVAAEAYWKRSKLLVSTAPP